MSQIPEMYEVDLGDWPGGRLLAGECLYPEAPDGGLDLVLPIQCMRHSRSWYWCLNAGVVWCDGGPPSWLVHEWDDRGETEPLEFPIAGQPEPA